METSVCIVECCQYLRYTDAGSILQSVDSEGIIVFFFSHFLYKFVHQGWNQYLENEVGTTANTRTLCLDYLDRISIKSRELYL